MINPDTRPDLLVRLGGMWLFVVSIVVLIVALVLLYAAL